ncbi:hypothetical protein [Streptosporangium carneum]|uniref:Secreted protein n=1 Tax=Streptosporangium carneum TaxID=47481 RepID=A0A9W6HY34_9ACTN|nr:hypothetical protein [Streptosporangium carneum]GLK07718.1 hypothetical protein GCM10017600_11230 [Streptosporangium carneum]
MFASARSLRRAGVMAAALSTTVALALPAYAAGPPISTSGIPRTSATWGADRWGTNSNQWVELPGASIPDNGVRGSAVVVVTFNAETHCSDPSDNGVCSVDIQVGGQQAHPRSDNYRFDTAKEGGEWETHSTTRTACFAYQGGRRDLTAKVLVRTSQGTRFELQNWHLKVDRYSLRAGSTCP